MRLFNTLTLKTSHTVLFWSFLGLIELVGEARPWRPASRSREWRTAVPVAAAVAAFFGALWTGALGMADQAFTAGMQTSKASERETRLRESLDSNRWSWRAHYELSLTLAASHRLQGAVEEGRATAIRLISAEGDCASTAQCTRSSIGPPNTTSSTRST